MGRTVAVVWHASFSIAAGILYFFFVLPRWPELMGDTSHTVGTVLRIAAGALIALAALPVVFTLLRTRKPEYGTPQLALTLRFWSIVGHVLAGALIIGTAISEIWLSLDDAGQWLFGIYGAAAAVAVLGISAFYLAFVAALPPPPPRPLKAKTGRKRRRRKDGKDGKDGKAGEDGEGAAVAEAAEDGAGAAVVEAAEDESPAEATVEVNGAPETADSPELAATGGLGNRRPSGKAGSTRRRRRSTAAPSSD